MKYVLQTTRWSLTLLVLTALALAHGQSAPSPQAEDTTMTNNSQASTQTIDTSAPVISRHDVLIDAPLERVWAIQTNVEGWTTWLRDIDAMTLEDSLPLEPGSVFRWETQGLDITSTVTGVDAPHRVVWGGPAQGIVAVHVWTFTDTPKASGFIPKSRGRATPLRRRPRLCKLRWTLRCAAGSATSNRKLNAPTDALSF